MRRQTGESEQAKPLGARRHQFGQQLGPPVGRSVLGTSAQHGGRRGATLESRIERIESGQGVIDAGQCFCRWASQRDPVEDDVDKECNAGLFADPPQNPDQFRWHTNRRKVGN